MPALANPTMCFDFRLSRQSDVFQTSIMSRNIKRSRDMIFYLQRWGTIATSWLRRPHHDFCQSLIEINLSFAERAILFP